ncbi:hypothetical protein EMIT0158MI4_30549 [Burkholderia ambifaria]
MCAAPRGAHAVRFVTTRKSRLPAPAGFRSSPVLSPRRDSLLRVFPVTRAGPPLQFVTP